MTPKKCFVISPIGEPGSEARDHADDLYKYVICPAMDELGIFPHRADHDNQVGRITDQMFRSILTDDLCIAVLTFYNPNVFYELAVAQAAARPVIILSLKGSPLPFDIKDLRVIEYDFRPQSIIEKVYVHQIVEMVRNLEATNWAVSVPFGPNLSPLGQPSGAFRLHDRVESFGESDDWLSMFQQARQAIDLSGITLRFWTRIPQFPQLVRQKAAEGCRIRVLVMHPDNIALKQYMNPSLRVPIGNSAPDVERSYAFFNQLARECDSVEVRRILIGCHHQQILRADGKMMASMVLYSEVTSRSPLFECTDQSLLYRQMLDEFEALWQANHEPIIPATGSVLPTQP